ncbi:hypothetical protein GIV76_21415 [Pseudomonas syringae]|uniref:hypothetical protein n=1 Tax=Pseudomonas syringae TaxID=317 RepID=UPI001F284C8D|nr:hypothetical protein [Pseudomonas syringae]MCF5505140.1 hypothetical protein [Pseudomonas syringae]MCF5672784.1 hypothetical protein [Pseudomonas syringae]
MSGSILLSQTQASMSLENRDFVGANVFAKASFQTLDLLWTHWPYREQAKRHPVRSSKS